VFQGQGRLWIKIRCKSNNQTSRKLNIVITSKAGPTEAVWTGFCLFSGTREICRMGSGPKGKHSGNQAINPVTLGSGLGLKTSLKVVTPHLPEWFH